VAKLRTTVHIDGQAYGPGEVPDEVAARISNPNVWDGEAPAVAGSQVPEQPMSPVLTGRQVAAATTADSADGPPPRGGAGSGRDAWSAYAAASGVEVDEDATRDDIVAALDAAGVPTE
jgi:hypothetical protein